MSVVLVLDAEQRAALACVRSLGRAGHTVFTGSHRSSPLAAASRWSRGNAVLPDPLAQAAAYAEGVRSLVQRWKIDVVVPVTDASALCLLPHRERIGAVIPFPGVASFERICDKAAVAEAARELGIGVPAQLRLDSQSDGPARLSDKLRFPVASRWKCWSPTIFARTIRSCASRFIARRLCEAWAQTVNCRHCKRTGRSFPSRLD